jgi:very-short-patch-repair endonuclease
MRENSVMRVAAAQHGAITAAQLTAAGLGRWAIERRLADGRLTRFYRGVYLVGPVETPLARASAALLAAGPTAVLSHRTAAELWELLPPASGPVHVTVTAAGPRSRENLIVHTTTTLPQSEVRRRYHLPLTSPERTLIDLAATADTRTLERAVEHARPFDHRRLQQTIERHRGNPGTAALQAVLGAPFTRSEAERQLLQLVRAAGLPAPRTNVRLGRFEVDAVWDVQRLVVKVDGYAFHGGRAAFERDRARDAALQALRYRVMRVTWRQLTATPHAVVAHLAAALAAPTP